MLPSTERSAPSSPSPGQPLPPDPCRSSGAWYRSSTRRAGQRTGVRTSTTESSSALTLERRTASSRQETQSSVSQAGGREQVHQTLSESCKYYATNFLVNESLGSYSVLSSQKAVALKVNGARYYQYLSTTNLPLKLSFSQN